MENQEKTLTEQLKELEQTPAGQAILQLEDLLLMVGGNSVKVDLAKDLSMNLFETSEKLQAAIVSGDKDKAGEIADLIIKIHHKILVLNELLHRPIPEA